jgi:hypothetical protein
MSAQGTARVAERVRVDAPRAASDDARALAARLASILRPPFDGWSPARLLDHFATRAGVELFPILDEEAIAPATIDAILDDTFRFAGETHRLPDPVRWLENPSSDVEWHILLHKFYYAPGLARRHAATGDARYVAKWMTLTDSWIATTPPLFIAADVTGRRVQNWIYAHHAFVASGMRGVCPAFHARFLVSLHDQVEALIGALAPARNHRTLALHAVFLAAVAFPEWRASAGWRDTALASIADNAATDILADGVHCELSTDYHHLVLRNLLAVRRLARLNEIAVPARLDDAIARALDFAMHVHSPLGTVPAFSDGDVHDYRTLLAEADDLYGRDDLRYVATRGRAGVAPAVRSRAFPVGGYYTLRSGWGESRAFEREQQMVIDCGPLGEGNHGHFDCLAFELTALGRRLIVDPGRYTYDEGGPVNWRARFRGTGVHNTVQVDGQEQTRYLQGPRRMKVRGPAPEHRLHAWIAGRDHTFFHGAAHSHEYPVVHERAVLHVAPEYWLLADLLVADAPHRYDLRFQLTPEASGATTVTRHGEAQRVDAPHLVMLQCADAGLAVAIDEGAVSTRYGEKAAAPVVRWTRVAATTSFRTVIYPHTGVAPAIALRPLPVYPDAPGSADDGTLAGTALTVRIGTGTAQTTDTWFVRESGRRGACRFGSYRFDGCFAFIRENAFGEVLRVHADPGARLSEAGYQITPEGSVR